jgi:glycosyltransferase involved in cell wall biosynthesis
VHAVVHDEPLVSICLPVFNGEELVCRAVSSALDQDYPRTEVVIVDDASTDRTTELLRDAFGDRVRLFRNRERAGQGQTTNSSVALARGNLVKFLHHDDVLHPDCVSTMVEVLERHPSAAMVFSRRRIELAQDDEEGTDWLKRYEDVHLGFDELLELNPSPRLFEQLLANGLHDNWVGEPVCVMVRRPCLKEVGGLSLKIRGAVDLGVWLRIAAKHDIAFIDRELVTYRHSATSHIGRERDRSEHWLDRLWMLEALLSSPEVAARYPDLTSFRAQERRMVIRASARSLLGFSSPGVPLGPFADYMRYRLRRPEKRAAIVGDIDRVAENVVPITS